MTTLHRIFVLLFILIVGSELHGQNTSSQHAIYIAELETAHSPLSNTFVSVSMKRPTHIIPEGEQILIHRSTDNTATWLLVDSFLPAANCRLIDPVITIDAVGNFYVVFMRIEHASAPLEQRVTHLDLYRSIDDGQSWHFVSSPYTHILPDYPQIIAGGEGELFLAFGNPLSNSEQHIVFMNSVDSGNTWSSPHIFEYPSTQASQIGIPDLAWGKDSTVHLSFGSSLYKGPCHIQSIDFGLSWLGFTFANQGSTAAQSSVLG